MRFFTSDLHDFHRNVINYCNRPYKDVEEQHEHIVSTWNSMISKDDTVYVLGDVSLNLNVACRLVQKLNGYKILVPGNHDACFKWVPTKERHSNKYLKMINKYKEAGWNEIHQTLNLTLSDGTSVLLSHLPYSSKQGSEFDSRYMELRPNDEGIILLHGHLHCRYVKKGKLIDVGWDNKLRPYFEQEIIDIIKDPRDNIDSRITEFYKTRTDNRSAN